ncbi:F-box only protein 5 [Gastrophryne carolinensis]
MKSVYTSPTKVSPSKAKLQSSPTKQDIEPQEKYGSPKKLECLETSDHQLSPTQLEILKEDRPACNKENLLRRFIEVDRNDLDCCPSQDSGYASMLENDSQYQDEEDDASISSLPVFETPKHHFSQTEKPLPVLSTNLLPALRFEEVVCSTLKKSYKRSPKVDWIAVEDILSSGASGLDRLIGKKMGLDRLDILGELFKRDFKHLLSKILRHLRSIDLINVICVSSTWRKILQRDSWAYSVYKQYHKEICEKEARQPEHAATRNDSLFRIPFASVQKVASAACCISKSNKKNKSASHSRHTEFTEVGKTLKNDQSLKVCRDCRSPAKYDSYLHRAICTRESCQLDFCTLCNCEYHFSRDCMTSKSKHLKYLLEPLPGSKKSKQNLRRL